MNLSGYDHLSCSSGTVEMKFWSMVSYFINPYVVFNVFQCFNLSCDCYVAFPVELMLADRHQKREIRQLEQELPRWQVLVDSITGQTL